MRTWKLVSGILCMVFFILVAFQSCAAGMYNSLSENSEISGSAGILVAVLMLTSGIISVSTRNGGKGGNRAIIIISGLAALIGWGNAGHFTDLKLWAAWCAICAIVALIAAFRTPKT